MPSRATHTQVKAARQEVLQHVGADIMGVRGAHWSSSTLVEHPKFCRAVSDGRLANQLPPGSLVAQDMRASGRRPAADLHHDHAFTRGEATTGWCFQTQLTHAQRRRWAAEQQERAARASLKHTKSLWRCARSRAFCCC